MAALGTIRKRGVILGLYHQFGLFALLPRKLSVLAIQQRIMSASRLVKFWAKKSACRISRSSLMSIQKLLKCNRVRKIFLKSR